MLQNFHCNGLIRGDDKLEIWNFTYINYCGGTVSQDARMGPRPSVWT